MRALGITVDPAGGRPRLIGVILEGSAEDVELVDQFEIRTTDTTANEQAVDLARLLLAKLPGLAFDRVAIRTAGTSPIARRNKAQFSRAHAEGAVLYVVREFTKAPVPTGDVQFFATTAGRKKDELVAAAKAISAGKHDAVVPALAQLSAS